MKYRVYFVAYNTVEVEADSEDEAVDLAMEEGTYYCPDPDEWEFSEVVEVV